MKGNVCFQSQASVISLTMICADLLKRVAHRIQNRSVILSRSALAQHLRARSPCTGRCRNQANSAARRVADTAHEHSQLQRFIQENLVIFVTGPRDFCHRADFAQRVILRLRVSSQGRDESAIHGSPDFERTAAVNRRATPAL